MIYLLRRKTDTLGKKFLLQFIEPQLGYFTEREAAEKKVEELESRDYEAWLANRRSVKAYFEEIRLYPELMTEWETHVNKSLSDLEPEVESQDVKSYRTSSYFTAYEIVEVLPG